MEDSAIVALSDLADEGKTMIRDSVELDNLLEEAGNEQTSGARFRELAHLDPKLAIAVAQNPHAPPDLLQALSRSDDAARTNRGEINPLAATTQTSASEIRSCVAANPNTPIEVLWKLGVEFPQQLLENPVLSLLLLESPNLIEEIPQQTLRRLFELETVPDYLCQQLLSHPDSILRRAIADSRDTSIKTLQHLARDSDRDIRLAVAKNPNNPVHLLEQWVQNSDFFVRPAVAENPNAPTHLLEGLARDSTQSIRKLAAQTLVTRDKP